MPMRVIIMRVASCLGMYSRGQADICGNVYGDVILPVGRGGCGREDMSCDHEGGNETELNFEVVFAA